MLRLSVFCVALSVLGCAASRPQPAQGPGNALFRDLERLVTLAAATGWHVDRVELNALETDAFESVCRTPKGERVGLAAWLDAEITNAGGPVEQAWHKRGRKLAKVRRLLTLTRMRLVLARAEATADGDCPFWLEPSASFRGRQISDNRWQLTFGGGGKGSAFVQGGEIDYRFGGAGRILGGYNFGSAGATYAGLELGGAAAFPKQDDGTRGDLRLQINLAVPLVYRYPYVNAYWEVETAWLGYVVEGDLDQIAQGIRLGIGFGARAARTRWLFPGGILGFSAEYFPSQHAALAQFAVQLGFRVAFDLDL